MKNILQLNIKEIGSEADYSDIIESLAVIIESKYDVLMAGADRLVGIPGSGVSIRLDPNEENEIEIDGMIIPRFNSKKAAIFAHNYSESFICKLIFNLQKLFDAAAGIRNIEFIVE